MLEAELRVFPSGKHDDQVDSISQCLNWLREQEIRRVPLVAPGLVTGFNDWSWDTPPDGQVGTLF